ncbi:MAG TPA: acetate--CoA ligase [Candidatus Saccharimonadales bacterium]|jgi:acetyl-CoA synthetase|nr:acetate--CoA ligase [Candidatus Saccharimonadales bacterium]
MEQNEVFKPPLEFSKSASVKSMQEYEAMYKSAQEQPEVFWAEQAKALHWFAPWSKVLDWSNPPFAKWFVDGKTNLSYNCLDRHLSTWRRTKAAIIWEGENFEQRILTYQELHRKVCKFANALKDLGLKTGDRSIIYMPMVPEAAIAMLACARLGITHSVVFGGFSAEALKTRIQDLEAQVVITANGGLRRGKNVPLKQAVDDALLECPTVKNVVVFKRQESPTEMKAGRDHWWDDLTTGKPEVCPAEQLDSEHPLYVLYTSGTTGKPKGVVHSTGGYLTQVQATMKWVFDLRDDDVYWCTADIGWVTGHSYVVFGPLAAGGTTLMYEGAPDWPKADRFWRVIEKYRVSIFYTSPTAIRSFIRQGDHWPEGRDLSSLRLLGSVGEPINPAAWKWYHKVIGKERCPIVDTWWQTETGSIMISPIPGATPAKPGSATRPLPGCHPALVDDKGEVIEGAGKGFLVLTKPWPAMLRTLYKDPERFKANYWSRFPGRYFTGDAAQRDEDGYLWLLGRVDDVINVSGHRLSTMEVESSLVRHKSVAEAAVVGVPHEMKGEAIHCFVALKATEKESQALYDDLREWVAKEIGALARPEKIVFVAALPKTRSGKIMRRLLREIVTTKSVAGDTTTLEDYNVILALSAQGKEEEEILGEKK